MNLGAREWFDGSFNFPCPVPKGRSAVTECALELPPPHLPKGIGVPIFGYCFEIKDDHKRVCPTNNKVGTESLDPSWLLTPCLVLVLPKAETTDSTSRLGFCFDPPKQRQLQTAVVNPTFLATVPTPMEVF